MSEAVMVALITGGVSLLGTVITILATSSKTAQDMKINQAVTDIKIEELTREVRKHNGFAERMPVVEEQIKDLNHRVQDLEDVEKK